MLKALVFHSDTVYGNYNTPSLFHGPPDIISPRTMTSCKTTSSPWKNFINVQIYRTSFVVVIKLNIVSAYIQQLKCTTQTCSRNPWHIDRDCETKGICLQHYRLQSHQEHKISPSLTASKEDGVGMLLL